MKIKKSFVQAFVEKADSSVAADNSIILDNSYESLKNYMLLTATKVIL